MTRPRSWRSRSGSSRSSRWRSASAARSRARGGTRLPAGRRGLSRSPARALPADRLGRPLPRRRRRERAERVDALGRRPPAADADRAGAGLRVRHRRRLPPAPDREPDLAMTSVPVLSIVTWAPFVGALLIMFTARQRPLAVRLIAATATAISAALSVYVFLAFDPEAGFQFYEKVPLVPSLGVSYELGVDGLNVLLVLLTSIIIVAGVFASWTVTVRSQEFYALLLALVTGVYGVFVSLDLLVFFLLYALAVLRMYTLIGIRGSSGDVRPRGIFAWAFRATGVGTKEYAAMKLTLYLLFGSAFILVGIFALYVSAGNASFSFLDAEMTAFDPALQRWVFLAFYVGFGILAGIWPLHTWSPDGHASAPTAVSMLHAGVLMKLGAYGIVRLGIELLPRGA